jgi:UDP:flavonoid glycosyltransferase YjiC (YdhE family)
MQPTMREMIEQATRGKAGQPAPRHVLIVTVGSHGDIHPFLAIGAELVQRGHKVSVVTNSYYAGQVAEAGCDLVPLGERFDLSELAKNPQMMAKWTGSVNIFRELIIPNAPAIVEAIEKVHKRKTVDVVLTHHIALGAAWACERIGVPHVVGCLSPVAWNNKLDPCILMPLPVKFSEKVRPITTKWARWGTALAFDGMLNSMRRELGLPARRYNYMIDTMGGQANLGLWSRFFRGSLPGDPSHGVICGFSVWDQDTERQVRSEEIERFLKDGDAPIVFTLGTSAVHVAGDFYKEASEACRQLGRRGMLLVGKDGRLPQGAPDGVRAFSYAPHSQVMPRSCAIVHHGGVGTTAQGLRAGKPTVIVPFAHDQFDNAARCERLGVSRTMGRGKVSAQRLAEVLKGLLADDIAVRGAAEIGSRMNQEHGAKAGADVVEKVAHAKARSE